MRRTELVHEVFGAAAGAVSSASSIALWKDVKNFDPILELHKEYTEDEQLLWAALTLLGIGVVSLLFIVVLKLQLSSKKIGKDIVVPKLDYLADKVKSGSIAFLKEEYKFLTAYVLAWIVVVIILFAIEPIGDDKKDDGVHAAATLLVGAFLSGLAGFIGMTVATDGNVRTTVACSSGTLNDGLKVAGGSAGPAAASMPRAEVLSPAPRPSRDERDAQRRRDGAPAEQDLSASGGRRRGWLRLDDDVGPAGKSCFVSGSAEAFTVTSRCPTSGRVQAHDGRWSLHKGGDQ